MLHCPKEKKSDGSKFNVLLFSFFSHLWESVVFIHKKEPGKIFLNMWKYFLASETKNNVEVVGVSFAE